MQTEIPRAFVSTLRKCVAPHPMTDLDTRARIWLVRHGYIKRFPLHRIDQSADQLRYCGLITDKGKAFLNAHS